ncbi:PH domain-containing protein [Actinocatenispora sera]|uniref:PH domain-containing protein n=1 Tax=Actinocatenispora sera TaxID=390989 RepID=UPI0033E9ED12
MATDVTARFRYNAAMPIAAFVALCGTVPLTVAGWPFAFVLLIPFAVLVWGWRAGVDVRGGRLVVRWPVGSRTIEPADIRGFTITHRRVSAVLADDRAVWLPAVPGTRVPVLAETLDLRVAGAPAAAEADDEDPGEPAEQAADTAADEVTASDEATVSDEGAASDDDAAPATGAGARPSTPAR